MTRGAAANAILDAGRSKKRSLPFPLCPRALTLARSLPSIPLSLSLFRALFLSLPCDSFGGASPSLSFFLLGPAPSFSTILARFFLGTLLSPLFRRRSPRGFPLSSLLMPRDRQMMIKKAPVRVRTTPRRPVLPPASLLVLHHLLLLVLLHPLLHLRQFFFFLFSSLDSLRCTLLPLLPVGSLSLSFFFFRRLISARSFPLSPSNSLETFSFSAGLPSLAVTRLSRASWSAENAFEWLARYLLLMASRKDVTNAGHYHATMPDRRW